MQPPSPQQRAGGSSASYIAIGCGLILVCACCVGGAGFGVFSMLKSREARVPVTGNAGGSVVVTGTVTSASGLSGVSAGTPCSFTVESTAPGRCRSTVMCGATTLYGANNDSGYFPCTFSASPGSVSGTDRDTTRDDRDPAFSIDSSAGTFEVRDDATGLLGAFTVTARISSVD